MGMVKDKAMKGYEDGTTVLDSWKIEGLIGSGSYGQVFRIVREEYGRKYPAALKAIRIPTEADVERYKDAKPEELKLYYDKVLNGIIRENDMMTRFKGFSNIVSYEDHKIISHDDDDGYDIQIRMELLESLPDYVYRCDDNRMSERSVIELGIDICKALEFVHKKHVVHNDIKPQNIFVSDHDDFKLGDFGVACTLEELASEEPKRRGTPTFMAPEVYKKLYYDQRADIYSLGIVLYTLINNNRSPFQPTTGRLNDDEKKEAIKRRLMGEALPDPIFAGTLLSRVIKKAAAYRAEDRYRSATSLRKDLEAVLRTLEDKPEAINSGAGSRAGNGIGNGAGARNRAGYHEPSNSRTKGRTIIIVLVAVLAIGVAALAYLGLSGARVEDLTIQMYDINYSQSPNYLTDGIDVLMKVRNDSNKAVKAVDYTLKIQGDTIGNEDAEGVEFYAYGYIEPNSEGYLYSHIYVDESTSNEQGDISITKVYTRKPLKDYKMPYGYVMAFHKDSDTYDVSIYNPNKEKLYSKNSVVIAVAENVGTLAGAWGAGVFNEDVRSDEKIYAPNSIFDPGFGVDYNLFKVFVIDKDLIGIEGK